MQVQAFPTALSPEDADIVAGLFQGRIYVDNATAEHALWQAQGLCQGHMAANAPRTVAAPLPHPEVVQHFGRMQRGILTGVPWAQLLVAVMALLQQMLSGGLTLTKVEAPKPLPPEPKEEAPKGPETKEEAPKGPGTHNRPPSK